MSKQVFSAVARGAKLWLDRAEAAYQAALRKHGKDKAVAFPETAFFLPNAYAIMGLEVKTVGEMRPVLDKARELCPEPPTDKLWLPYLGQGLDAGVSTLLSMEVLGALKHLDGFKPAEGYDGFMSDTQMRELGIQLVDGRMPGFAALLGAPEKQEDAVAIIRELQKRSLLVFLVADTEGRTMKDHLDKAGVEMGWDTYIVPVGPDSLAGIYVLDWAIRSALTFGGKKRGDALGCLQYTKDRIFAFGVTFGPIPDEWYAIGAAAIIMGFPVISDDKTTPEVRPTGVTLYEALVRELDYGKIVPTAVQVRGVKVKVEEIDIPVAFAAAFEGERVRGEDLYCQMGGKYSTGVELLRNHPMNEVEDGKIELIGPDIDSLEKLDDKKRVMPLGIEIKVAGRKMQEDFEGILERRVHTFLNHAQGLMHMGQRNINWIRISKGAYAQKLRLRHFGVILHAKLHDDFGGIVDKVQVTIYTEKSKVDALAARARKVFDARDARVEGMTDESVDIFYSCTICQSYAPDHVCVITPERLGLCGAYNWLDGKAAFEMNPSGQNQPIKKGPAIEEKLGEWEGVNKFVYGKSNHSVSHFSAYSIMQNPMTSCGCFECIVAVVPEANGVMVVNREYGGMTPIGMPFSTLAGSVGGGAQTPGFVGVGRLYMASRKFISAEGGLPRIVWMPKDLKEDMRARLDARAKELGLEGFVDKIADETIATDSAKLLEHMAAVSHPALTMPSLI